MNIIFAKGGPCGFFFRPDTTLNREGETYYVPDGIRAAWYMLFSYVRIDKAGKHVASRFAERYYSAGGSGAAIFGIPERPGDGAACLSAMECIGSGIIPKLEPEEWMLANSLDNSTVIAAAHEVEHSAQMNEAVESVSSVMSLRTGDMVCVACSGPIPVSCGETIDFPGRKVRLL